MRIQIRPAIVSRNGVCVTKYYLVKIGFINKIFCSYKDSSDKVQYNFTYDDGNTLYFRTLDQAFKFVRCRYGTECSIVDTHL